MEAATLLNLSLSVMVISQVLMIIALVLGFIAYAVVKIHDKVTGKSMKEHQKWLEYHIKMEAEYEARQLAKLKFWHELNKSC